MSNSNSTQTQNIFIENTQKHTHIHPQGWNPAGFICLSSSLVYLQGIIRPSQLTKKVSRTKQENNTNPVYTLGNYSLDQETQINYITGENLVTLRYNPPVNIFLSSRYFFIFCLNIGSDVEDCIWHGKEFQSFAPYSFRLNRRMSTLPYNTWRSSTFRVPCSWQSRLYWYKFLKIWGRVPLTHWYINMPTTY